MSLVRLATFGSLPEASIAFSALTSSGFNPVAGYNMNTPGSADGMAPSAYPLLVPDNELLAARQLLADLRQSLAAEETSVSEDDPDEQTSGPTTLGRIRSIVRYLAAGVVMAWIVLMGLALFRR